MQQDMINLPCGCIVPRRTGKLLNWLRRNNLIGLFDLIHNEAFVRFYRKEV